MHFIESGLHLLEWVNLKFMEQRQFSYLVKVHEEVICWQTHVKGICQNEWWLSRQIYNSIQCFWFLYKHCLQLWAHFKLLLGKFKSILTTQIFTHSYSWSSCRRIVVFIFYFWFHSLYFFPKSSLLKYMSKVFQESISQGKSEGGLGSRFLSLTFFFLHTLETYIKFLMGVQKKNY